MNSLRLTRLKSLLCKSLCVGRLHGYNPYGDRCVGCVCGRVYDDGAVVVHDAK
jgi:hypothetical protein